ncbi:MAG: ABC transporter permease [Bdellovibrionales bacterium]|nr:ABC transporter permease [Bdellovibrionales bacterium]
MNLSPDSTNPTNSNTVLHVRADQHALDFTNIFSEPFFDLFRYQGVIRNIVARDLKVRYKRSFLGVGWTVLAPLMSMLVMWTVFTHAFGVQMPFYAVYLLSGIIVWNVFLQSSAAGCVSIMQNASLIRKVKLPRVVFPLSAVANNMVNFVFAGMALMLVVLITGAPIHSTLLLVPVAILPLLLFASGWAMMVSALSVFFRDLQYILEIFLGAMFYLTPILYEAERLPARAQWIVSLNPMAKFIHLFRTVVFYGQVPQLHVWVSAMAMGLAMLTLGWVIFQRLQRNFIYWL